MARHGASAGPAFVLISIADDNATFLLSIPLWLLHDQVDQYGYGRGRAEDYAAGCWLCPASRITRFRSTLTIDFDELIRKTCTAHAPLTREAVEESGRIAKPVMLALQVDS